MVMEMVFLNLKKNFPILILTLRKRLGLSQEKLAAQLGVSFQTVNRWERGHTRPSQLALSVIKQKLIEMEQDGSDLLILYFGDDQSQMNN
ncbi:helix-turn-helix transcriptional regulator [Limnoraphis robusta Tam1]|nr:helix-turn-helix transcriptional regulator [Limnoraphis robusta]MEA5496652.1 helix-turn-helix transcriptional regulator [Limnoraphis robusta BA-68 BA1]MEA5522951.1 helix-turn-helix transcriptional regulator [Limnoraphis robusta CCNP1315]MEA5541671.1 helix-turn-helix transcriptional regulator [Limnoraphis robusta Tam1]MEA5548655.1 helix-turn-helix transcriptional regulator [Limnoraphis robusta CCNP1324]